MIVAALCCALAGCGRHEPLPAPLGTLAPSEEPDWLLHCGTDLVRTTVCGRDPWTPPCAGSLGPSGARYRLDGNPLHSARGGLATHRIRCGGRLGWSVWTDDHDRILGACANPSLLMDGFQRVRRMLDTRRGHDFDRVTLDSVLFAPGVHFWTEPVGLELHHAPDGTIVYDRSHVVPGKVAGCLEVILDE